MKLGYLTSIVPDFTLEQCVEFAGENGFECIEAACWPAGKAERRYAGVSHIDMAGLDAAGADRVNALLDKHGVTLSGIGYYPNPLSADAGARAAAAEHLRACIRGARLLGVGVVNTFIGKDRAKSVAENFKAFKQVWPELVKYAEDNGVKIGIENCPMYFRDEGPGGDNLASSPAIWREMFSIIDSGSFGLNYDPSHLVWQRMDYLKPVAEFKDKLFHVHLKDARFYAEKYDDVGFLAAPLDYHAPKLPGQGDIDWGAFVAALNDAGYTGSAVIEVEDRAYEGSLEDRLYSIVLSQRYLRQYI